MPRPLYHRCDCCGFDCLYSDMEWIPKMVFIDEDLVQYYDLLCRYCIKHPPEPKADWRKEGF